MAMRVVGSVLVRNEDLHVEQAIRNVAAFCDRIHAVDHVSTDRTWDVLRSLSRELDNLDVRRARHARVSHEVLEPYVGTPTWALRVDGDELYDPAGLVRTRALLEAGELDGCFRVQANVLHCVSLERTELCASGYLSPPSRPITALFNLGAVDRWTGCAERLHSGEIRFRFGYAWDSVEPLHERFEWDGSPLRYLHACFVRRSSAEPQDANGPRRSLGETGMYRRGVVGTLVRAVRKPHVEERVRSMQEQGSSWKLEKYRRGPLVSKDVSAFFPGG